MQYKAQYDNGQDTDQLPYMQSEDFVGTYSRENIEKPVKSERVDLLMPCFNLPDR